MKSTHEIHRRGGAAPAAARVTANGGAISTITQCSRRNTAKVVGQSTGFQIQGVHSASSFRCVWSQVEVGYLHLAATAVLFQLSSCILPDALQTSSLVCKQGGSSQTLLALAALMCGVGIFFRGVVAHRWVLVPCNAHFPSSADKASAHTSISRWASFGALGCFVV